MDKWQIRAVLRLAGVAWIAKVIFVVVADYRDYMPPNFWADFLLGRESYFFGGYHIAFYVHIVSGPLSLLLGMVLLSQPLRNRFPVAHRSIGKVQVANVLLLVVPSGLAMSFVSRGGLTAKTGFALLALLTGFSALLGWRMAARKRFKAHELWMLRCFTLLCSAVVLRLFGGLASIFLPEAEWTYPVTAWASWLGPLLVFELVQFRQVER